VPADRISFGASWRTGATAPDFRVTLPVPEMGWRTLPVKDHHLLLHAEASGSGLEERIQALNRAVLQMGPQVAVRLGLSRPFQGGTEHGATGCWLMADGFFSLTDPQP
jgi:hypothetical protein